MTRDVRTRTPLLVRPDALILHADCREANPHTSDAQIGALLKEFVSNPENGAAGLAAPQIGYRVRICAVKSSTGLVTVMYNPTILWFSPRCEIAVEGCLSIPDKKYWVERATVVTLRYTTEHGMTITSKKLEGWDARVAQHEIDHLNGILISDVGREYVEDAA